MIHITLLPQRNTWLAALGQVLFPPHRRCTLCGETLDEPLDDGICPKCLAQMPWIEGQVCPRCGLPQINQVKECPDCKEIPPSFSLNRSLWSYRDGASAALRYFKFNKRPHLAYCFAEQLATKSLCFLPGNYDIITYVPMHPQAERARGYNQSALLAQTLAERTSLPLHNLLQKNPVPAPQHQLGRIERWQSISQNVFILRPKARPKGRLLLIDDIFTTGATAHFCSLILLEAGAEEVTVLTVARSV